MSLHYEFRFSGTGGQGLMLLGDVMSQAAGCLEDKYILLTKSYGPEARGGACRSEMIVSDEPINYPAITRPNLMIAMSQKALNDYKGDLSKDSILIVDEDLVTDIPKDLCIVKKIPMTRLAEEATGKTIAANVVALGVVAYFCGCIKPASIQEAVRERFDEKFRASNDKAFEAGYNAAKAL